MLIFSQFLIMEFYQPQTVGYGAGKQPTLSCLRKEKKILENRVI